VTTLRIANGVSNAGRLDPTTSRRAHREAASGVSEALARSAPFRDLEGLVHGTFVKERAQRGGRVGPSTKVPLGRVAGARSGDKSGNANVGFLGDVRRRLPVVTRGRYA
jgi:hypothetical protein